MMAYSILQARRCLYDGLLNTTGYVYMMVYSILQARRCLYDGLLNTTG